MPPTGSSWIAAVCWRPRPSCLPHGVAVELIEGHGVHGSLAGTPGCRRARGPGSGMARLPAGACGPRAVRGREAGASPESSGMPGFREAAGSP